LTTLRRSTAIALLLLAPAVPAFAQQTQPVEPLPTTPVEPPPTPPAAPPADRSAATQSQPANLEQSAAERLQTDMSFVMETVNKARNDDAPLRFREELDKSVQICRSIRREYPGYVVATMGMAECLRLLNRGNEAVDLYSEVLQGPHVEHHYIARKGLGKIYADAQWYQLALSELEKASAMKRGDKEVYRDIARCYEAKNDLKKALEYAQYAVEAAPDDPALRMLLSRLLAADADFIGAEGQAQRSMKLAYDKFEKDPTDVVAISGLLYYSRFRLDIIQQYLDFKTNNTGYGAEMVDLIVLRIDIWKKIAILAQLLSLHEALRWAEEMNTTHPDDARLMVELAKLQHQLQMSDEARKTMQRVLEISPGNEEAKTLIQFYDRRESGTTPPDQNAPPALDAPQPSPGQQTQQPPSTK
jgi:tetratricopeptide (TPR) repeat protein